MLPTENQRIRLLELATEALGQAHAPYSQFRVGAALLTRDGRYFSGCNVENLSFGLTICAERNAVAAAVLGGMRVGQLLALTVVGDTDGPITPCGACRQVIIEFAHEECLITGADLHGHSRCWMLSDLLPEAFSAELG